jgi:hypothetical protein
LVTVTVYEIAAPGVADAAPSDFVTAKSACALSESVSVDESLPGTGSVVPAGTAADAVFVSEPVAEGLMVPETV